MYQLNMRIEAGESVKNQLQPHQKKNLHNPTESQELIQYHIPPPDYKYMKIRILNLKHQSLLVMSLEYG